MTRLNTHIVYKPIKRHRNVQTHDWNAHYCDVCGDKLDKNRKCSKQRKEDALVDKEWKRRIKEYGVPSGASAESIHPDRDSMYE